MPDQFLRRSQQGNGLDVEIDVPLTVPEAALGTKIEVPTVEGPVVVTVPPGTSSGAKLRLRGKGIKRSDGSRGDQICFIQIAMPKIKPDDDEAKRTVESFARLYQGKPVRNF